MGLIGDAGQVAIEGHILRGAGPQRRRQVEVLLGILVAGADVGGSPVPADRGDAALFQVPAGGAICDESPPLRIDVVQAQDGGLFARGALEIIKLGTWPAPRRDLLAGEGLVAVDAPKIGVQLAGTTAGVRIAETMFVVDVPMEDGSLRGERQGGSSCASNKGAASRGGQQ